MKRILALLPAVAAIALSAVIAAEEPPRKTAAVEALEEFQAGLDLAAKGDRKTAVPRFEKAILLMPQWSLPRLELAVSALETGGDPKGALDQLRTAATLDAENPRIPYFTGAALERTGDLKAARESYEKSLLLRQAYKEPHAALGRLLKNDGKNLEARPHLQLTVEVDPKNTSARLMLAEVCEALGELDGAERELKELINQHPENPYHQHRLAQFYERTGQKDKAKAAFKASEKTAPTKPQKKLRPLQPSKK
jgi:tetratricopeptide (TPR) repeat protein